MPAFRPVSFSRSSLFSRFCNYSGTTLHYRLFRGFHTSARPNVITNAFGEGEGARLKDERSRKVHSQYRRGGGNNPARSAQSNYSPLLPLSPFFFLFLYLSIYLPVCPSICLPIHRSIHLFLVFILSRSLALRRVSAMKSGLPPAPSSASKPPLFSRRLHLRATGAAVRCTEAALERTAQ